MWLRAIEIFVQVVIRHREDPAAHGAVGDAMQCANGIRDHYVDCEMQERRKGSTREQRTRDKGDRIRRDEQLRKRQDWTLKLNKEEDDSRNKEPYGSNDGAVAQPWTRVITRNT